MSVASQIPNRATRLRARMGILFLARPLAAHSGEPLAPHDLWTAWIFEPGILIGLAVSAWLYFRGARGRGRRTWETACFAGGWLTLSVALVSPIHPMGGVLFSAHMIQHELLMLIAAPLLVLSRPLVPFLWGLPLSWRREAGRWSKSTWVQRPWHVATKPLVAWSVHALALWIWHAPPLFQATLESDFIHALQHASFLSSALLFWWAVIHGHEGRMGYGVATFYVFTTAVHSSILGALLTFAPSVWYPAYTRTTAAWGLTPLEDQQIGGLIMWVPAGVVYLLAGLALFGAWLRQSETKLLRSANFVVVLAALVALSSCSGGLERAAAEITGGNPGRGRDAIGRYGCPACHTIPGVSGAYGLVGPPLSGVASRVYIAGMLSNTPENLIRWIQNPKKVNEHTAMPNMGVTPSDAQDIAGYLYTLK
jgi:putative membrane protein